MYVVVASVVTLCLCCAVHADFLCALLKTLLHIVQQSLTLTLEAQMTFQLMILPQVYNLCSYCPCLILHNKYKNLFIFIN